MTSRQPASEPDGSFLLRLTNFEGPFDLLLQLIGRRQLDITEVALSQVTDEFIAHVKVGGEVWDLEQTSSFLVVAATLLDLKAARLLPSGEVEDQDDLAVLEARDLLFARLLQYRAYKQISAWFADRMAAEALVRSRPGGLEDQFRRLLPEVTIPGGPARLAKLAERAFTREAEQQMPLSQLHLPQISVAAQAGIIAARMRAARTLTFRALTQDATRLECVARFLALLELFRQAQVSFEQLSPLGELTIRWTGQESGEIEISDEFDLPAVQDNQERTPEPNE
ncbi:MAG: segregation/condensation protein A [Propionibacterium sp.]|jgi:segregation and condensation protein A|nr:segregation/condensation protein A [Propionibacterium sp.]